MFDGVSYHFIVHLFTASYQTDVDDPHGKSDRALMRALPEEEKEQIQVLDTVTVWRKLRDFRTEICITECGGKSSKEQWSSMRQKVRTVGEYNGNKIFYALLRLSEFSLFILLVSY